MAASARGASHERYAMPCQDAHAWRDLGDGWTVVAVADGAGSARLAEHGAAAAVEAAVAAIAEQGASALIALGAERPAWDQILRGALARGLAAVTAEAERQRGELRDLASTLLIAVVGRKRSAGAQIGDGAIVIQLATGEIVALTVPDPPSEYINEAVFLVSPHAVEQATVVVDDRPPRAMAVFSDGLQLIALTYPSWTPRQQFFSSLFAYAAAHPDPAAASMELGDYLTSPALRAKSADDITLVLVSEPDPAASAPIAAEKLA